MAGGGRSDRGECGAFADAILDGVPIFDPRGMVLATTSAFNAVELISFCWTMVSLS